MLKTCGFAGVAGLLALAGFGCGGCSGGWPGRPLGLAELTPAQAQSPRVVVYYMHRTLRCISCLSIEKMTRDALTEQFAAELASGRLQFRVADYWIDQDLARQYDVTTVSVVTVNLTGGREVSHRTLDRVWELKGRPAEFETYVVESVRAALVRAG